MIAISDSPVAGHSIEKVAACRAEKGLQSIALGAKALALTALELIRRCWRRSRTITRQRLPLRSKRDIAKKWFFTDFWGIKKET